MNTQQQIDQQLNDDFNKFYETKYNGKWPIPDRLIDFFKSGIKALSPFKHQINFHKVKAISSKTINELTFGDIHEVIKVVLNTPCEKIIPEIGESNDAYLKGVEEFIKIEKFVLEYNVLVEDLKQKLEMKKVSLEGLANPAKRNGNLSVIN